MLDGLRTTARNAGQALALRALLVDCRRLLSQRGDANSGAIAALLVGHFRQLGEVHRLKFFDHLAHDFGPEPAEVRASAEAYTREASAENLLRLVRAVESPRQELLRRINRAPGGTAMIVAMRATLLGTLRGQPERLAVEADFLHLLSSWFNPGFLGMQQVDWDSPARLLEQLIEHEAVHEIHGWSDLRRRLQPDRRCFAFFHPQLPREPLIFVEVALLREMPSAIAPLIDPGQSPLAAEHFKVAAFYSISNCQPGLRGVSLGNFLIKRVAEQLKRDLPQVRLFCTLSPIPGFAAWLAATTDFRELGAAARIDAEHLLQARGLVEKALGGDLGVPPEAEALQAMLAPARAALLRLCAAYLLHQSSRKGGDPVARFHLTNGARLERIHLLADLSPRGRAQSFGLMVNYLYDLRRIEANHERFARGQAAHADEVAALIRS